MSSFKKNRTNPSITKKGELIVQQAENKQFGKLHQKYIKEITIPFTEEMSGLLESIFLYFEGDISRRKLCSKYLLRSLKEESKKLKLY